MTVSASFEVFLWIMGSLAIVALIFYSLWAYVHKVVAPKLDPILFRSPFFNEQELVNYKFFPLSLVKSISYSYLVAYPSWAKRKRFKQLDQKLDLGKPSEAVCRVHFTTGIVGVFLTAAMFLYLPLALIVYS